MTTTDSNGLIQYQTTDNVVPLQTTLNAISSSVSTSLNSTVRTFKVANDTERNALATARVPSATNPLIVFNSASGKGYHEINTGSGWSRFAPTYMTPILATLTSTILLGVSTMKQILSVSVPASAPPGLYRVDALTVTLAYDRLPHYWQVQWGTQTVTSTSMEGMQLENLTRPATLFFDHTGGAVTVTLAAQINGGDSAWNRAQPGSYLAVQQI